jgi:hypothetical protein
LYTGKTTSIVFVADIKDSELGARRSELQDKAFELLAPRRLPSGICPEERQ